MAVESFFRRASVEVSDRVSIAAAVAQERVEALRVETQRGAEQAAALARSRTEELAATPWAQELQGRADDLRTEMHQFRSVASQRVAEHAGQMSTTARSTADRVAVAAGNLREQLHHRRPTFELLPRGSKREQVGEPWGAAALGTQTRPPLVVRMISSDRLTPCSMEIEWENGTGERQQWSSHWHPLSSFFEAEKVLPSSATDVSVRFKVQAVVKSFYVGKVDRHCECSPTMDDADESIPETFWFWRPDGSSCDEKIAVDMTFELKGSPSDCHVWRAWNAARGPLEPDSLEYWPDVESRPLPRARLKVLHMADTAALPDSVVDDPLQRCKVATQRLVAAAKALQETRRETLGDLRRIDQHLTRQWIAVNSTNTAGAGLAVASAAALFVNPVVGIGLGVASAATSGAATAGDFLADQAILSEVRRCLNDDDMNVFAVADLQQEWLRARDRAGEVLKAGTTKEQPMSMEELSLYGTTGVRVGLAVASTILNAADTAGAFTVAAESAAAGARMAPVASKALGVAGAVVSAGLAVHGWVTTKSLQALTRQKLVEISKSTVGTQRWLAAMSELECAICLTRIELSEEAQCCSESWHYSHASCLNQWEEECRASGRAATCPLCCGPVSSRKGRLEDLMMEDMRMLVPETDD